MEVSTKSNCNGAKDGSLILCCSSKEMGHCVYEEVLIYYEERLDREPSLQLARFYDDAPSKG